MVPSPTYQNLPTFGTGASLVQPIAGTYNGGFLPGQLFPAEYENWLMNYITANSNTSQTSVVNLVAEMGTILTAASITPNGGLTNQVKAALDALYATVGALSSEASTRANADTTLQGNINANTLLSFFTVNKTVSVDTTDVLASMAIGETRNFSCLIIGSGSATSYFLNGPATGSFDSYFESTSWNISTGTLNNTYNGQRTASPGSAYVGRGVLGAGVQSIISGTVKRVS